MALHSEGACLWIVVLNWNQFALTERCLASLEGSTVRATGVVLVDNGSTDGSAELLRSRFSWLHVVASPVNVGFAEGNNLGIRYALDQGADLVLLLNNDTEVDARCVEELVSAAVRHTECALFCPRIYYFDPQGILWYAGGRIDLGLAMGAVHLGQDRPDGPDYAREDTISFVTGCAFMIRRKAIEDIGLLDQDFFIYCEDLDWSIRAARAGYRALFVPRATLRHKVSSTYHSPRARCVQAYLLARNRFIVQRRYRSAWAVWMLLPVFLASTLARGVYGSALRGDFDVMRAFVQGLADGIRRGKRRYPMV